HVAARAEASRFVAARRRGVRGSALINSNRGRARDGEGLRLSDPGRRARGAGRGPTWFAARPDIRRQGIRRFGPVVDPERATRRLLAYVCLAVSASRSLCRVTVAGVELAVQVRGDGIPPVLFIHGFPFDHTLWRHQIAALSRWHCVAPDLRGAGMSSVPGSAETYSVGQYAAELLALLDALDLAQIVVCGQSIDRKSTRLNSSH